MAEWTNAAVSKTVRLVRASKVRILLSPPLFVKQNDGSATILTSIFAGSHDGAFGGAILRISTGQDILAADMLRDRFSDTLRSYFIEMPVIVKRIGPRRNYSV